MKIYEKILDWLVPVLLGAILYYLQNISAEIRGLSTNMAVVTLEVANGKEHLVKHDIQLERFADDLKQIVASIAPPRRQPR